MSATKILGSYNKADPLRLCSGESRKANAALRDYIALGAGRSLEKLFEVYSNRAATIPLPSKSLNGLKTWSARNAWQARVTAWEEIQNKDEEEKWAKRREEIRLADYKLGAELRKVVEDFIEELPKVIYEKRVRTGERIVTDPQTGETIREVEYVQYVRVNATPAQLGQAAKAASDLQRLAAGMEQQPGGQQGTETPMGGVVKHGYVLILPDNGRAPSVTRH